MYLISPPPAGAAGYLGTELTKQLLDRGYTVRATVRSDTPKNTDFLRSLAKALPGTLEIVEADLDKAGSYDKIVQGAKFVFHTASPVSFGVGNPEQDQKDVVDPAVNGTKTVLKAAAAAKVERVVLTSSVVAICEGVKKTSTKPDGSLYGPDDWNTDSTLESNCYMFSKVQAEKAAWALAKELNFDLVTVLPSLVLGPVTSTRDGYSRSLVGQLLEGKRFEDVILFYQTIDVRDAALAHILAAETPGAKGRYITSRSENINFKQLSAALKQEFPKLPIEDAAAHPDADKVVLDNSKLEKDLGLTLTPTATTIRDHARTVLALGLVEA